MKEQNRLLKNAFILILSMALTKLIGAALKIPLTNILGGIGMGYYSTAYSLFSPVYALIAAGLPTAVTRLVAQNIACGNYVAVKRIKRTALVISAAAGVLGCLFILVSASPFSKYIANSWESRFAITAIAPSLIFCCISSVYKGYYEGLSNMYPTAISQIVESVVKAVLGLLLSCAALSFFGQKGRSADQCLPYAAAAAIIGVTAGEICGAVFLFLGSRFFSDSITQTDLKSCGPCPGKRVLGKKLLSEAFPISLGAVVINLSSFADLLTIPSGVNACIMSNPSYFRNAFPAVLASVSPEEFGTFVYGSYTGIVLSLFMLVSSTTALMGKSTLPDIAASWETGNTNSLSRNIRIVLGSVFAIGLPICMLLGVFAEPITSILYPSRSLEAAVCIRPMQILSFGGITVCFVFALFSVFQAIGRADVPVKLMMLCSAIKLLGNLTLTQIPSLSVSASAISTVVSHIAVCIPGFIMLKKTVKIDMGVFSLFFKPFAASTSASALALYLYYFAFREFSDIIRLFLAATAAVAVYLLILYIAERKQIRRFLLKKTCKKRKIELQ